MTLIRNGHKLNEFKKKMMISEGYSMNASNLLKSEGKNAITF